MGTYIRVLGWDRLLRSLKLLVGSCVVHIWLSDSMMGKLRGGVLLKHVRLLVLKVLVMRQLSL